MIPYSFINPFNTSFINSLILTRNEGISLNQMLNNQPVENLLYRGSRDGYQGSSFHSKCDNISNTVTIIKTAFNSVFGGFTSAQWKSNRNYSDSFIYDANAFIFSLRRSGNLNNQRFNVTRPSLALFSYYDNGPAFGDGYDINIRDNSITYSYELPNNITYYSSEAKSYLAGSSGWYSTEIEVYQVTPFEPYSVTFLHNGCLFLFDFKILFGLFYNLF